MSAPRAALKDAAARRVALTDHGRGLLVEAGAGSGKTAVLAGRVALLLAGGVRPSAIAAITFTELAAAELATRVSEYVDALAAGIVPVTLGAAFGAAGPSAAQRSALLAASQQLDELTCSTIHGFARQLARPYPVEAAVDPGAVVLDAAGQGQLFQEVAEEWLRWALGQELTPAAGGAVPSGARPTLLPELFGTEGAPSPTALLEMAKLVHDNPPGPDGAELSPGALPAALHAAQGRSRNAASAFLAAVDGTPGAALALDERLGQLRALATQPLRQADSEPASQALDELTRQLPVPLFTQAGGLRAFRVKGKWVSEVAAAGLGKAEATASFEEAERLYGQFGEAHDQLRRAAADLLLHELLTELAAVGTQYRATKRAAAALDFDDLISTALQLLRQHPSIRDELAARYQYVLIDEFQDTDPLQAEIVWRLTGQPNGENWRDWPARGGARFVVGDPKQSIYRFRGADAATYAQLSDSLTADAGAATMALSTNFRSRPGILEFVNASFAQPLAGAAQPGYRPLDGWQPAGANASVCRLLIPAPNGEGQKAAADALREAEAETVAELVLQLVNGTSDLVDGPVSPGDIALLAPVGSGLELYERALDQRGLNVASQAGKGFYRRQEVQDLVALTRALADPRDRLALGALLRGPLVGATDEELLDATEALAHLQDEQRYLSVLSDPQLLQDGFVKRTLQRLQPLVDDRFTTTPYALLTRAVNALEVRATLTDRHGAHADRALANLDRFLEHSRGFDVRGLTAFARQVSLAWADKESELEGRADSASSAVTLITIHSAKGLEWQVVIPVNTASEQKSASGMLHDRRGGRIVGKLFGQACSGYDEALAREEEELRAERIRLWYVAATRARQLLIVPQHAAAVSPNAWSELLTWPPDDAPYELAPITGQAPRTQGAAADVAQSAEQFLQQQRAIQQGLIHIERRAPSRRDDDTVPPHADDDSPPPALSDQAATVLLAALDEEEAGPAQTPPALEVGAARGILLHKVMEELITGECLPQPEAVRQRVTDLLAQLPAELTELDPAEVATMALRAWQLPEVAPLHGSLQAEVEVAGVEQRADGTTVYWGGVADAIALSEDGAARLVLDWKSDRNPSPETLEHYRHQLRAYLKLTGAVEGMIVLASLGRVERVAPE